MSTAADSKFRRLVGHAPGEWSDAFRGRRGFIEDVSCVSTVQRGPGPRIPAVLIHSLRIGAFVEESLHDIAEIQ